MDRLVSCVRKNNKTDQFSISSSTFDIQTPFFPRLSLLQLLDISAFDVISISPIAIYCEEPEPERNLLGRNEIGSRIVNLSKLVLEDKESSKLCPMSRTRVVEIRGSRERETRGNCEGIGRGVIVKKKRGEEGWAGQLDTLPSRVVR